MEDDVQIDELGKPDEMEFYENLPVGSYEDPEVTRLDLAGYDVASLVWNTMEQDPLMNVPDRETVTGDKAYRATGHEKQSFEIYREVVEESERLNRDLEGRKDSVFVQDDLYEMLEERATDRGNMQQNPWERSVDSKVDFSLGPLGSYQIRPASVLEDRLDLLVQDERLCEGVEEVMQQVLATGQLLILDPDQNYEHRTATVLAGDTDELARIKAHPSSDLQIDAAAAESIDPEVFEHDGVYEVQADLRGHQTDDVTTAIEQDEIVLYSEEDERLGVLDVPVRQVDEEALEEATFNNGIYSLRLDS